MNKIIVGRIIVQNSSDKDIGKYLHNKNISLKAYRTSVNLPKDKVIYDYIISLIKSNKPLLEILHYPNLEKANRFDRCIIRNNNIDHPGPIYYIQGIHKICSHCRWSICLYSERMRIKIGKIEYKARRKKLLLFRKSEIHNLIDNNISIYIYQLLMFKI